MSMMYGSSYKSTSDEVSVVDDVDGDDAVLLVGFVDSFLESVVAEIVVDVDDDDAVVVVDVKVVAVAVVGFEFCLSSISSSFGAVDFAVLAACAANKRNNAF